MEDTHIILVVGQLRAGGGTPWATKKKKKIYDLKKMPEPPETQ